ncbi:uncharacterized protein [Nicotiana tomentosiformis]|uniref:uncharacterized protein n=1 Tax=Nicotiana tomentosiformis TaxID=4098 RepID=UPI00388C9284
MVREKVLLKVLLIKGIMRFGKKGKLRPRFIGPFEVLRPVGEVFYEIVLPPSLLGVHLVFYVFIHWRNHPDLSHVLDFNMIQLDESLGYEEDTVSIVDRQGYQLRSKRISTVEGPTSRGGDLGVREIHAEQISSLVQHSGNDSIPVRGRTFV